MLRALLEDRFRIVVRTETREMPIYALVTAGGDGSLGPQLRRSTTDCKTAPPRTCGASIGSGTIRVTGQSVDILTTLLPSSVGGRIDDQTGLTGLFDFELKFSAQVGAAAPGPDDPPSVFTALQEQLGLKLQPTRGPVDVIVIDRIERPSEN